MDTILINDRALAKRLGVSVHTIRAWTSQRRIPSVHLGRARRYDLNRIKQWVREHSCEPVNLDCNT